MAERMGVVWALAAASFGAALVPACGNNVIEAEVRALGEGCLLDSGCEGDLVCVFRRCHVACQTTADCKTRDPDAICVLGERPTNVCLLPDEMPCEASVDCAAAMRCGRDSVCRDACATDASCVSEQTCLKGTCGDVDGEPLGADSPLLDASLGGEFETCRYNSECFSPLACRGGICEPECITDRDCDDDDRCTLVDDEVSARACVPSTLDVPPHCIDGALSGDESDVDCGGSCSACASGAACVDGEDCVSDVCQNAVCQVPSCFDGTHNGGEKGADCGGPCIAGCGSGTACDDPDDCASPGVCLQGACAAPTCTDGLRDGLETDTDCGGPMCPTCADGDQCETATDCASSVCTGNTCIAPTCDDGVDNGAETAVDCGGGSCRTCGNGAACVDGADCESGSCVASVCAAPTCSDGVMNGFEGAVDCGGGCPSGCALGTSCTVHGDCDMSSPAGCFNQVCTAERTLTVTTSGSGSGTVVSSPPGLINCGGLCSVALFEGQQIVLHTIPDSGSQLVGFSGACSGSTCTITVAAADLAVDVAFGP